MRWQGNFWDMFAFLPLLKSLYLIQTIGSQLYGFMYSYQIQTIRKKLLCSQVFLSDINDFKIDLFY